MFLIEIEGESVALVSGGRENYEYCVLRNTKRAGFIGISRRLESDSEKKIVPGEEKYAYTAFLQSLSKKATVFTESVKYRGFVAGTLSVFSGGSLDAAGALIFDHGRESTVLPLFGTPRIKSAFEKRKTSIKDPSKKTMQRLGELSKIVKKFGSFTGFAKKTSGNGKTIFLFFNGNAVHCPPKLISDKIAENWIIGAYGKGNYLFLGKDENFLLIDSEGNERTYLRMFLATENGEFAIGEYEGGFDVIGVRDLEIKDSVSYSSPKVSARSAFSAGTTFLVAEIRRKFRERLIESVYRIGKEGRAERYPAPLEKNLFPAVGETGIAWVKKSRSVFGGVVFFTRYGSRVGIRLSEEVMVPLVKGKKDELLVPGFPFFDGRSTRFGKEPPARGGETKASYEALGECDMTVSTDGNLVLLAMPSNNDVRSVYVFDAARGKAIFEKEAKRFSEFYPVGDGREGFFFAYESEKGAGIIVLTSDGNEGFAFDKELPERVPEEFFSSLEPDYKIVRRDGKDYHFVKYPVFEKRGKNAKIVMESYDGVPSAGKTPVSRVTIDVGNPALYGLGRKYERECLREGYLFRSANGDKITAFVLNSEGGITTFSVTDKGKIRRKIREIETGDGYALFGGTEMKKEKEGTILLRERVFLPDKGECAIGMKIHKVDHEGNPLRGGFLDIAAVEEMLAADPHLSREILFAANEALSVSQDKRGLNIPVL